MKRIIINIVVALLLVTFLSFAEEKTKSIGGGGEVPFLFSSKESS